jgi:hypothetical protein
VLVVRGSVAMQSAKARVRRAQPGSRRRHRQGSARCVGSSSLMPAGGRTRQDECLCSRSLSGVRVNCPTGAVVVLRLPNVIRKRWRPVEDRNDVTLSATAWDDHVTPIGAGHASIAAETAFGSSSRPYPPWTGRSTVLRSLPARTSRRHPSPASQRTSITNNRVTRVAVTVAMVALIGSGCSSSGVHTNGLEKKSATQVQQAAVAALKAAKSVHVTWTGRDERKTGRLDMRTQGNASTGIMGLPGVNIGLPGVIELQITTIGPDLHVKTDRRDGNSSAPSAHLRRCRTWPAGGSRSARIR